MADEPTVDVRRSRDVSGESTAAWEPFLDLGKWPRVVVAGESVTPDQAAEIIVRTDGWWLSTNDRAWEGAVYTEVGIPMKSAYSPDFDAVRAFNESVGGLNLSYLGTSRIASSWIGGPKGWVDWNGEVGASTWNIGKWPSYEEVEADWAAIAAAWPFLSLRCQLVTEEGEGRLAVEYVVQKGTVSVVEPVRQLAIVRDPNLLAFLTPGGERGCTLDQIRHGVALAKAARTDSQPEEGA